MPTYQATIRFGAGAGLVIEADTPEEAAQKAYESEQASPALCHYCAGEVDLGDAYSVMIQDEDFKNVLYDDDFQEEIIKRLQEEKLRLQKRIEELEKQLEMK